ncbi:MAG: hypothetical protein KF757_05595 [Phycisphaeraceae bacterium]|nr:hypothetical protein [Phycisphaeraceae bacterium]MCW5763646.1 hypothetical protein [Phycisphaeraceae bacterium]
MAPSIGQAAQTQPNQTLPAGQVELARLVDLAAGRLGVNVEYDASVVRGSATMRFESAVSDLELWYVTNRVLVSRGLTTVRLSGDRSYSVVRLADAAGFAPLETFDDVRAAMASAHAAAAFLPVGEGLEGGGDAKERHAKDNEGAGVLLDRPGAAAGVQSPPHSASSPEPGFRSIGFGLRHRPAREVVETLTRLVSKPGGSVQAAGESMVVVSDLSPRLAQVLEMAVRLDLPAASARVEEVALSNLSGVQMTALIMQVAAKRELATGRKTGGEVIAAADPRAVLLIGTEEHLPSLRELVSELDSRERLETVGYTPLHFAPRDIASLIEQTVRQPTDDRWRMIIDEITGSLVITTTPASHEQIATLITRLDAAPSAARRPVRTFVIRNRSVLEMRSILEHLLASGILEAAATESERTSAGVREVRDDGVTLAPPPLGSEEGVSPTRAAPGSSGRAMQQGAGSAVMLSADEHTNTLIAAGEPRLLAQIESLLRTLDVRQSQVMLDVLLVTLTESQSRDLGVELEQLAMSGQTSIRLSSLFGLGTRTGGQLDGPVSATGLTGVVLNPGDFSIVLRAIESISDGRSLSMPTLLVGNNQVARLDSVVQQPFASVNASNTVSTTSFGGTQDAGTTVTIVPQIAEGDHLLLEYSVSLSAFLGPASSPTLPPARQQNRVSSVATIPDGYTVVVGGIEIEDESQSVTQVPLLGRIPVVGEAFKSRSRASSHSKFYVFIRASVMREHDLESLKHLSDRQAEAVDLETGWPVVEPRVIR